MIRILLAISLALLPFHVSAADDAGDVSKVRTGAYSETMTLGDLFSGQFAENLAEIIPLDTTVSFQVYAPTDYDPVNPPGLLAYISPIGTGEPPKTWVEKIENANLIWVSVNNSGNITSTRQRIIETLACVQFISQRYQLDSTRSYVSGLSGGGRAASIVAKTYPGIFNGAIYMIGVDPIGAIEPEKLEQLKHNRFVFLTGSSDFNRKETQRVYRRYKNAGIERSKLIVVSGMGHRAPQARWVEESINYLDSFLRLDMLAKPSVQEE